MRFLLYNIRYGAGNGTRFHLPFPYAGYLRRSGSQFARILDFIRSVQPDVLGLVEVDGGSFRTGRLSQAELIAEQLGYHFVSETKYGLASVAKRLPLLRTQGNAILSRMPIISHRFHFFDEGVKRLVIQACTEYLTLFLVHLSLTYRNRQYQFERLYRLIRQVVPPLILPGEFNVRCGKRELELFLGATGLVSDNPEKNPYFPSRAPKRELDFILHSPELRVVHFQIPPVLYSDHAPLICDFEMR